MTAWLTGMLAIASLLMVIGVWPVMREELKAGQGPWWKNKALRISGALYIHGIGAIVLFASPMLAGLGGQRGFVLYAFWTALGLWLFAKVLIVSAVSRWFWLCMALFVGWSAACAFIPLGVKVWP